MEQIIMNTTTTLSLLQSRTDFWKQLNNTTNKILIILLAVVLVLRSIDDILGHNLADIPMAIIYALVIAAYSKYSVWFFKRQAKIFTLYNNANLKEGLSQTVTTFKRFYWNFNVLFVIIGPIYFYATIKLFIPYWHPTQQGVYITCIIATIISLIGSHWYYSVKFFKKLRSLDENLKELESQEN